MSYRKRTVKRGTGEPQVWQPSTRGEGRHAFVDPTPVGLGAKQAAQKKPSTAQTPQPKEKTANRPPTTTKPVQNKVRNVEVDPQTLIGGIVGRLILGDPFKSISHKMDRMARRQGIGSGFQLSERPGAVVYATADKVVSSDVSSAIAYCPGFMLGRLEELYRGGTLDKERTKPLDIPLTGETHIRLNVREPVGRAQKSFVTADVTDAVADALANEQRDVRRGLGLPDREFNTWVQVGYFEGVDTAPYDLVGQAERELSIATLSLGQLTVLPRDL